MKSYYLPLPEGRIHYLASAGKGPCLLMLHGNSSSATAFSAQFAALGDDYRLLAVDLPGHGLSDAAPGHYSFAGYAQWLVRLVAALELSDYFILGHSLGGHAALEALPTLSELRGLILLGAPPFNSQLASHLFARDPSDGLVFTDELAPEQIERLARAFVHHERNEPELLIRLSHFITRTDPAVRAELGRSLAQGQCQDELQLLARHRIPTLLLQGRDDAFIKAERCLELARQIPHLRVELIDDCGHCPHLEQPQLCHRLLDHFVHQTLELTA